MQTLTVEVKRIPGNEDIELPQYMTEGAAGLDLRAAVKSEIILEPGDTILIPTGIALKIPLGYEAQIRPRSGLAMKYGITLLNSPGTIDADYRGEIGVIFTNFGKGKFVLKRGDRIAQMVFAKVERVTLKQVSDLEDSVRGSGGFGHTGL